MFLKVVTGIALIVSAFLFYVAMQPADFVVERSLSMRAAPRTVYNQVQDFHKWAAWSPWSKMDPNAKNTFEGPASGLGSSLTWEGNKDVGSGKMTIVEANLPRSIRIQLDFYKPMAASHQAVFTFVGEEGQTKVTWQMSGKNSFMGRIVCVFMDMDKMVGENFEKGLADLKTIVEKT